ncbi:amino acid ABC transporter permease [uncultured Roseibium sp.]|uniref:amino acid ABC transporter permease n=1 Tax=uncultured Roseibium sp. TaxID=1936171 RepID=UPI003217EA46
MELRFFEIYRNHEYISLLLEGSCLSIALTVGGGIAGFVFATGLAGARYARLPILSQISAVYVEFVRNTPLIVQMFFVAFGLPLLFGYQWPFWGHAFLALTLNFAAYFAEILRAGFGAMKHGQLEAAAALGIPKPLAFWKITFPQAVASMYPSLSSQFVFLFLTTGIISEIGVRDLTYAGLFIDSRSFRSFEVFFTLTVLYILIALGFKYALKLIHDRMFPWRTIR